MVIAQNERDMGYPGYVRERPKFMGYLGRVYRQGLATFFQVKKRGRRVFFSEKKSEKNSSASPGKSWNRLRQGVDKNDQTIYDGFKMVKAGDDDVARLCSVNASETKR